MHIHKWFLQSNRLVSIRTMESVLSLGCPLTLYQPMTHICVMSSHKPIRIYMGGLILGGVNVYTLIWELWI